MRLARAVALRWGGVAQVIALGASMALLRVWDAPVEVPGRDDVRALVTPLVPVFAALVTAEGSRIAGRDLERLSSVGNRFLRVGYGVAVLALLIGTALVGHPADRLLLLRNGILLTGVGIGAASVLPPRSAWPPVVLLPMVSWLLGSRGLGEPPAPWAVLLLPAGSVVAGAAAFVVAAASFLVYLHGGAPRA